MRNKIMVKCLSVPIYTIMNTHQFMMQYVRFNSVINYISELQLSHVVKHITHYVYYICQLGFMLFKID